MKEAILWGLLLGCLHGATLPAKSNTVTPSFTRGTMTSTTDSFTTVTENFVINEYSTGRSYTMTGTNIKWDGPPRQGANYRQAKPGAATSFSETTLVPGLSSTTNLTRTTTIQSTTSSISVFTQ